jgi:hypothetical protein
MYLVGKVIDHNTEKMYALVKITVAYSHYTPKGYRDVKRHSKGGFDVGTDLALIRRG